MGLVLLTPVGSGIGFGPGVLHVICQFATGLIALISTCGLEVGGAIHLIAFLVV